MEVVVKERGKIVRIIDTKTNKSITLRSGVYELELKDAGKGLKLNVDRATLTRGETVLAKIERIEKIPSETAVTINPGKIEMVRRIPTLGAGNLFYYTSVSRGGKYALVTSDTGQGVRVDVYNAQTGAVVLSKMGYQAEFIAGGDQVVVAYDNSFRVYELPGGKMLHESKPLRDYVGMRVAPGAQHLVYWFTKGFVLYDLIATKEVHVWHENPFAGGDSWVHFSADGKRLALRLRKDAPWIAWDVENNRAADDLAGLAAAEIIYGFFPDGKTAMAVRGGKLVRLDVKTGKAVEPLRGLATRGGLHGMYSVPLHCFLVWCKDGSVSFHRVPFEEKELGATSCPPTMTRRSATRTITPRCRFRKMTGTPRW